MLSGGGGGGGGGGAALRAKPVFPSRDSVENSKEHSTNKARAAPCSDQAPADPFDHATPGVSAGKGESHKKAGSAYLGIGAARPLLPQASESAELDISQQRSASGSGAATQLQCQLIATSLLLAVMSLFPGSPSKAWGCRSPAARSVPAQLDKETRDSTEETGWPCSTESPQMPRTTTGCRSSSTTAISLLPSARWRADHLLVGGVT